eukprot:14106388-Alexandrium_andersonii.AAC.1
MSFISSQPPFTSQISSGRERVLSSAACMAAEGMLTKWQTSRPFSLRNVSLKASKQSAKASTSV